MFEAIVESPSYLKDSQFQPNALFGMHLLKELPSVEDTFPILREAIRAQPKDSFGKMKRLFALHPGPVVDVFLKENKNWEAAAEIFGVMKPEDKISFMGVLHKSLNSLGPINSALALTLLTEIDPSACSTYVECLDSLLEVIGIGDDDQNELLWAKFPENVACKFIQASQINAAPSMERDPIDQEFLIAVFEKMDFSQKKRFIKKLDLARDEIKTLLKPAAASILRSMHAIDCFSPDYPSHLVAKLFVPIEAVLEDSDKELYIFHPKPAFSAFIHKKQLKADSLEPLFGKMTSQRKKQFAQLLEAEAKTSDVSAFFSRLLAKRMLIFISSEREKFPAIFEQLSVHFQTQDPEVYACYPDVLFELLANKKTHIGFIRDTFSKMSETLKLEFLKKLSQSKLEGKEIAKATIEDAAYFCLEATLTWGFLKQEKYPDEFLVEFLKWPEQMANILMVQGNNVVYAPFFDLLWSKMEKNPQSFFIDSCLEVAKDNKMTESFYASIFRNYQFRPIPVPLGLTMSRHPEKLAKATKLNGYFKLQSLPEQFKAVFMLMDNAAKCQFLMMERVDNKSLFADRMISECTSLLKSSSDQMKGHYLVIFFAKQPDLFVECVLEHKRLMKETSFFLTFLEAIGEQSIDIILKLDAKNGNAHYLELLKLLSEETRWLIFDKDKMPSASRVMLYSCFFSVPTYKAVRKTFDEDAFTNFEILINRLKTGSIK